MTIAAILNELKRGAQSTAQLAAAVGDCSAYVSRDCSKLLAQGRIVRLDARRGRGSKAIYALAQGDPLAAQPCFARPIKAEKANPGPVHPGVTVSRDPCFKCGTRGDLGCAHRPAFDGGSA